MSCRRRSRTCSRRINTRLGRARSRRSARCCYGPTTGELTMGDVDQEAANTALVEEKFAAWAAGTGSPYDLLADDVTWTITGHSLASKTYNSREAFLSEVIRPFNARMSAGLKPKIRNIYAD